MIAFGPHIVFRNILHGSQCFTKLESSIIRLALTYSVCCRPQRPPLYRFASHHFLLLPAQPPQALAIALPSSPAPAAALSPLSLAASACFWFLQCSLHLLTSAGHTDAMAKLLVFHLLALLFPLFTPV